jgi:hypothetical protein
MESCMVVLKTSNTHLHCCQSVPSRRSATATATAGVSRSSSPAGRSAGAFSPNHITIIMLWPHSLTQPRVVRPPQKKLASSRTTPGCVRDYTQLHSPSCDKRLGLRLGPARSRVDRVICTAPLAVLKRGAEEGGIRRAPPPGSAGMLTPPCVFPQEFSINNTQGRARLH